MKRIFICTYSILILWVSFAFSVEVPINPITENVKEKLKKSVELVSHVEDDMAPKVKNLEKIYKTYIDACKGRDGDRGCVEIKNQLSGRYEEVLQSMEKVVPEIQKAISSSATELGNSIHQKTRGKNVSELYQKLSKKRSLPKARGPLSAKLSNLLTAVGTSNSRRSILELSLQTQADLVSASEILDFLRIKVTQYMVMNDMGRSLPELSPEMVGVMKGVADLFGYDVEFGENEVITEAEHHSSITDDDWRN